MSTAAASLLTAKASFYFFFHVFLPNFSLIIASYRFYLFFKPGDNMKLVLEDLPTGQSGPSITARFEVSSLGLQLSELSHHINCRFLGRRRSGYNST